MVEQSGIYAGDDGFQVNVSGNTNLTGAIIASTEKAIIDNKNSLTTETLMTGDIQNSAEYKGKATSATVGGGIEQGLPTLSGAGIGSDEDKADSVTISGVSNGIVSIIGKDAVTTIALLNRDVHVNEQGEAVDSAGNSTAYTIAPIFDAEKVAKEIEAQVQITQAFGQQANYAVGTYVQIRRKHLREQFKAATEAEKSEIQAQLDSLLLEERVMNVLIGAVTGFGGTAITKESLSIAAEEMRQITIANSKLFAGITDGTTTLNNMSGESEGVRGDGVKAGGTRVDLDLLCGAANERCAINDDGSLKLNEKNQVIFIGSLADFLVTDEGKKSYGDTGGIQGWKGTLFNKPYTVGSWQDKLIEAFSGTHDLIGGQISGLYDGQGNIKQGMTGAERAAYDRWSAIAILQSCNLAICTFCSSRIFAARDMAGSINFIEKCKMKQTSELWIVLLSLNMMLIGCINIEPALSGKAFDEYQKSLKPYLQNWEKAAVTPEKRRLDSVNCGSIDSSQRNEPDGEPQFTQEKIKAAHRPADQSTTTAEARLLYDWQHCMLNKGYNPTESWVLLPVRP